MESTPGTHPHFDDGGAVTWYTRYADALAAAKAAGRLVFVEMGRAI
jgi:hypothetical protein